MSLTVLSVAYPFAPVGPDAVGGAEQVLSLLDRELAAAGHRSVVVACEGSCTAGELVPTPAVRGAITKRVRWRVHASHRAAIRGALEAHDVDVVHLHGIDFHQYLPPGTVPTLATLHLPPGWYPPEVFTPWRPNTWLHPVSAAQRRACPPSPRLLGEIPNGVPVDRLCCPVGRRGFALALGRVCPEKGFHHALDAARLAGVPLLVAGEVFPYEAHRRYHREALLPRLDGERRFLGPVGFRRKRRLLSAARCLLVPSLAPETSSLVAMEALACGTPVIAFKQGALPEIVDHGVTGFLVDDAPGMADAIRAVHHISPDACRRAARERFSAGAMAARYLALYERLAQVGRGGDTLSGGRRGTAA